DRARLFRGDEVALLGHRGPGRDRPWRHPGRQPHLHGSSHPARARGGVLRLLRAGGQDRRDPGADRLWPGFRDAAGQPAGRALDDRTVFCGGFDLAAARASRRPDYSLIERSSQRFQSPSLRLTLQPSLLRTFGRLRRFSFLAWDGDALNERSESSECLLSILLLAPILLGLDGNHALL